MTVELINNGEPIAWKDFLTLAQQDIQKSESKRQPYQTRSYPKWLFRGQSNASWELKTTLERYWNNDLGKESPILVDDYYIFLGSIIPALNSLGRTQYKRYGRDDIKFEQIATPFQYELLCYSRHLGFPSPLLDWSRSLFIASFFAFKDVDANKNTNPSIYAFRYMWGDGGVGFSGDEPVISECGPYVETHPRHFSQQSQYSICSTGGSEPCFYNHEKAAKFNPSNQIIKKYVLKHEDKESVLSELFAMNINDYTLFGDDESLIRTLAYKEFRNL